MKFWQNWTKEKKVDLFLELSEELTSDEVKQKAEETVALIPLQQTVDRAKHLIDHPNEISGLSTGWGKLDRILGGMGKQELIIIGGQTGHGKSLLAQNMALHNALQNKKVLFFTLEMSMEENTARFLTMYKHYSQDDFVNELPIYYLDLGGNITIRGIDKCLEQAKDDKVGLGGLDLMVIDHLHFFARSAENTANEIGIITKEIKKLARKYDIPILLISHVRKINSKTEVPEIDDLRDSSFIGQDADSVIMIWRDMNDPLERDKMVVAVKKNRRRGTIGKLKLQIDKYYKLNEVTYDYQ